MARPVIQATWLALWAVNATILPAGGFAQEAAPGPATECPYIKPMHGLMPILFWIGLLPKPTMASTIAASDTSTSIIIRPDPKDQIACGRTKLRAFNDISRQTIVRTNTMQRDVKKVRRDSSSLQPVFLA